MTLNLAVVMRELCERISAQGVPAVLDERDINPPCLMLRPPELAWRFGGGRYDATWTAVVLVPSAGRTAALGQLGQLVEAAAKGIRAAVLTARPSDYQPPDNSAPLPGMELSWTSKIITP